MAISPKDVPAFLVLEPKGGVRLDLSLPTAACEISAALEKPRPGRSFVLMIGAPGEPFVQRARIAGRAKLHYEPGRPGLFVVLLTNPMSEPAVVRLKLRPLGLVERAGSSPQRPRARVRRGASVRRRYGFSTRSPTAFRAGRAARRPGADRTVPHQGR